MGMTHDALAVKAFKTRHGRRPERSLDHCRPDEAWIQKWKADYIARKCRGSGYAVYYARRLAWLRQRGAKLRLAAAERSSHDRNGL